MIGRRYKVEKKVEGRPSGNNTDNKLGQNVPVSRTSKVIADQFNLDEKTVRRAEELTEAIDTITALCYN